MSRKPKANSLLSINWFNSCNNTSFTGMTLTLHKSQVHCSGVMQWWACNQGCQVSIFNPTTPRGVDPTPPRVHNVRFLCKQTLQRFQRFSSCGYCGLVQSSLYSYQRWAESPFSDSDSTPAPYFKTPAPVPTPKNFEASTPTPVNTPTTSK